MACGTVQIRVRAEQRELRAIVIECRVRPEDRSMTVVALLAVSTLMLVLAAMTVDAAIIKLILEVLLAVAVIALQSGMRVFQRKVGFGVIELNAAPR